MPISHGTSFPILVVGPHTGSGHRDRCQRLSSPPASFLYRLHASVIMAALLHQRSHSPEEIGSPGGLGDSKELSCLQLLLADEDAVSDSESAPSPTFSKLERTHNTDVPLDDGGIRCKSEECPPTPLKGRCVLGSATVRSREGIVDDGVSVLSLPPPMGSPLVRIVLVAFGRLPLDSEYPCSHPTSRASTPVAPLTRRTHSRAGTRAATTEIIGMLRLGRLQSSSWTPHLNLDSGPPSRPRASFHHRTPLTSRATTQMQAFLIIPKPFSFA